MQKEEEEEGDKEEEEDKDEEQTNEDLGDNVNIQIFEDLSGTSCLGSIMVCKQN